jgi:hypothetical protein
VGLATGRDEPGPAEPTKSLNEAGAVEEAGVAENGGTEDIGAAREEPSGPEVGSAAEKLPTAGADGRKEDGSADALGSSTVM